MARFLSPPRRCQEDPKFDGDLGVPKCFIPLAEEECTRKAQILKTAFSSQGHKHSFTTSTFTVNHASAGNENAGRPSGYPEGFYCREATFQCLQRTLQRIDTACSSASREQVVALLGPLAGSERPIESA